MPRVAWLPAMSVGIDKWDSDHKVLLRLINQLDDVLGRGGEPEDVRAAIDVLVSYAEVHFRIEERAMSELGYPAYASHKAEHDGMRAWIAERRALSETAATAPLLRGMAEHLVHWLYSHVLTIDMQYTDFFDRHRRRLHDMLEGYRGLAARTPRIR